MLDVPDLIVAQIHRPAHCDHTVELAEGRGIPIDRSTNIGQRPDRNQRDFAGISPNLFQNEVRRIRIHLRRRAQTVAKLAPNALFIHRPVRDLRARRHSRGNRNIAAPGLIQQTRYHSSSHRRITRCRRDAQNPELRALQRKCYRKRVIDISADVRINDDLLPLWRRRRDPALGTCPGPRSQCQHRYQCEQDGASRRHIAVL